MARKQRIEFPGAFYHVLSRGHQDRFYEVTDQRYLGAPEFNLSLNLWIK